MESYARYLPGFVRVDEPTDHVITPTGDRSPTSNNPTTDASEFVINTDPDGPIS
jgi:hypothetical protein